MDTLADTPVRAPEKQHIPIVFLLDVSSSMESQGKIQQLREGLQQFKDEAAEHGDVSKWADISIVTFGSQVSTPVPFVALADFKPPQLTTSGATSMGAAILLGLEILDQRKRRLTDMGVGYYRPWVFMITDGEPTDMKQGDATWNRIVQLLQQGEDDAKFAFFPLAVTPADMTLLQALVTAKNRRPIRVEPGKFKELFVELLASARQLQGSKKGDDIKVLGQQSKA